MTTIHIIQTVALILASAIGWTTVSILLKRTRSIECKIDEANMRLEAMNIRMHTLVNNSARK